jgi:serine/threonine-protein phosphatase 2A activator
MVGVDDYPALVLKLFTKYLTIMRHLQTTYYLEPAGSHGVWGLDDYQFLPFVFGSAQLYSHPHIRPKSIHNEDILEEYSKEYIYLGCIAFINSIKTTADLRWHSPMLDDVSSAKNWGKINGGMIKMYDKEVLGKLPVMQHFLFGGLIPAVEGMSEETEEAEKDPKEPEVRIIDGPEGKRVVIDRDGMTHVHSTWGECCGIKVPSAAGARLQEESTKLRRVPRIPFD